MYTDLHGQETELLVCLLVRPSRQYFREICDGT